MKKGVFRYVKFTNQECFPMSQIDDKSVWLVAWRRTDSKPLPQPVLPKFYATVWCYQGKWVNTLRPRQNGRHFSDDIFEYIFLNENVWISLKISLKFIPTFRNNNIPALIQIMVWRRPGDKPISEPMMVSLLTHICVTQPQWVNMWYMRLTTGSALVIMTYRLLALSHYLDQCWLITL